MKKALFLLFLILIAVISISLTAIFYSLGVVETMDIKVGLKVPESDTHIGFDTNESALKFGIVPRGVSSTRVIEIYNDKGYSMNVKIIKSGFVTDWIDSETDFIIKPNESRRISFTATVPEGALAGNYSGNVRFIFKKKRI
ncbi:hypothetical protein J4209_03735 [Candidatus Woesearchaeota archaeon]|nr:hypothetical protein [Candidatus Woesearchaeota archaeon]